MNERMKNHWRIGLTILLAGVSGGCSPAEIKEPVSRGSAGDSDGDLPKIYVVNYPLYYFTTRIVGDHGQVMLPKESGGDPGFWRPNESQILAYQEADLILLWGADYAKWVSKVSLPVSRVVDTSDAIRDRFIFEDEAISHSHGNEEKHSHGATASTTWLDCELMVLQSLTIYETLKQRFPESGDAFGQAYRELEADLMALDQRFKSAIPKDFNDLGYASHPVYQYLSQRYGLSLVNFHWEPGEMPDDKEWALFQERMEDAPAKWMLWEGEPSAETRQRLEMAGVMPILFPTHGGHPDTGDWLSLMQENADRLARAFSNR